jgi:hypothetical protein
MAKTDHVGLVFSGETINAAGRLTVDDEFLPIAIAADPFVHFNC